MQKFPEETEISEHFFNKLAYFMNNWLNKVITERSPMNNPIVREAYRHFHKMCSVLPPEMKREVLLVTCDSEIGKVITAIYQRGGFNFLRDDQMSNDISAILEESRQRH